ncbi:MAG TPA: DUF1549 and DUF1553 domain-containing protein [Pirellulales bacterium]|nr:DUF1549 and DUF1553 domain-containing protein [Pirellulales bacterium]
MSDGRLIDLSRVARCDVADSKLARVDGHRVVGIANGETRLTISAAGNALELPVRVAGFDRYPPVHFANDIVPLFSRLGCNGGGCHGKATGQNGFKLSVFGFDPVADYGALVKEARGRRVFPAGPERSLVVEKALAEVPHGGGRRMEPGSTEHELLLEWIKQGLPVGNSDAPRPARLYVSPNMRVLRFGGEQQILATVVFSDGAVRDVTAAALYATNAASVAEVNSTGLVGVGHVPGEAAITVNYMGLVAAVQILVPRPSAPDSDPYPSIRANNRIDELVWEKLRNLGIVPSGLADDATFLRRLYLDTLGTLPTSDEVRAFLCNPSESKRSEQIERVLARDEYADFWALKWSDVLLVDRKALGDRGAYELHRWLRQQLAANRPYDAWVRELLTASGNSGGYGPTNLYRVLRTPEELTRAVSQAFLGIRLECAQCHHHPFERWSQDDFYGLAGFFNGLERKPLGAGRDLVFHSGLRDMTIPVFNRVVPTHVLDGRPLTSGDGDPRQRLAQWMTEPGNPWFARLLANRLWKQFFGRGLVDPEDDLRSTNPATNEPLLSYLTQQVVASGFDVKTIMRQMLASRTYQLSSAANATNADDERNFSHYYVRRLPAEVLLDAICDATGAPEAFVGSPPGTRAIELWDNRLPSYFLEIFGRPQRNSPCECGRSSEPTMSQALHLMNAPEIERKISDPSGRVARLVQSGADPSAIVEELCLVAIGRAPAERERQVAEELFAGGSNQDAAEDFLWALLNSYDFLFTH